MNWIQFGIALGLYIIFGFYRTSRISGIELQVFQVCQSLQSLEGLLQKSARNSDCLPKIEAHLFEVAQVSNQMRRRYAPTELESRNW